MTVFRVMTWNVQNLFLPTEGGDGPDTWAAFEEKVSSLAAVIDQIEPHVLALQEIGSSDALSALQNALTHAMPNAIEGMPDDRGIRVAFLSRRVIQRSDHIRPFPPGLLPIQTGDDPPGPQGPPMMNQMGRGGLGITVRGGNRDIHVVTTHMKSKLLSYPDGRFQPINEGERARYASYALFRRATEATTLRVHLNGMLEGDGQNRAVILAGDMNDEVEAATTQILNGPGGSEIGTVGFDRTDQGDGDRIWNLAPLIPAEERCTRIYRGRREVIDHIFASHLLCNPANLPEVHTISHADTLPSISDNPRERRNEPGSDHAALFATFDL